MKRNLFKTLIQSTLLVFACCGMASCNNSEPSKKIVLDKPTISVSEDGLVSWKAISKADDYSILVDDVPVTKPDIKKDNEICKYTLNLEGGIYNIQVQAMAYQTERVYSEKSDIVVYKKKFILSAPEITLSDNRITWNNVAGAASYQVFVNGSKSGSETVNTYYNFPFENLGDYSIYVQALSNNDMYKNSEASNVVVYQKTKHNIKTPVVTRNETTFSWQSVENASGYNVFVDEMKTPLSSDVLSYTLPASIDKGKHVVSVQAVSNDPNLDNSVRCDDLYVDIHSNLSIWSSVSSDKASWGGTFESDWLISSGKLILQPGYAHGLTFSELGAYLENYVQIDKQRPYLNIAYLIDSNLKVAIKKDSDSSYEEVCDVTGSGYQQKEMIDLCAYAGQCLWIKIYGSPVLAACGFTNRGDMSIPSEHDKWMNNESIFIDWQLDGWIAQYLDGVSNSSGSTFTNNVVISESKPVLYLKRSPSWYGPGLVTVSINGAEVHSDIDITNEIYTKFDLSDYAGEFAVDLEVKLVSTGSHPAIQAFMFMPKDDLKLNTPNPSFDEEKELISWDVIEGAIGYKVYINNGLTENVVDVVDNFYSTSEMKGTYSISVKAIADPSSLYTDSDKSEPISITVTFIDKKGYWEYESLVSNWSYEGEIEPLTNRVQGYLVQAKNASTTISNLVKVPAGAKYFKISLLTYLGVAPKVTIYLNKQLVKAEGATENYVTPAVHNNTQIFAYDLGDLTGNISVDIKVESIAQGSICTAYLQSVGFSEFAYETDHVSNLTKWTKGQMCLDWTIAGAVAGNTIEGYGNGCYHLFANGGFKNNLAITNSTKFLSLIVGTQVSVKVNGTSADLASSNPSKFKYTYDLSAYVGQTVEVEIKAINECPFVQAELMEDYMEVDKNGYWEFESLISNWSWSGEIAPITNQPQGYLVEATNLSTTISNYVKIPEGAEYFKFGLLTYGGVAPKVTVYLNGTLVKAEGATEDYVTPEVSNNTKIFAYDLGSLTGNISVDIKVESTETGSVCTAFFPSVGFSEFAYETNHVSNLTKWTKGQMCLDWTIVGTIAGDTIEGYGKGCYCLFSNGGFQNTISVTNETKYLSVIAGWQLTVTANGNPVSCLDAGTIANRYIYDLSVYVGQNVVIRITATAPDFGPFAQVELLSNI